jgi:hypothetical protein
MTEEHWLPIAGYEGLYEVSNLGRVRSTRRRGTTGRVLAIHPNGEGYAVAPLWRNNRVARPNVHRIVMAAFAGPCPDGLVVRHLNGNRMDPRLVNLTYGTAQENALDRVRHATDVNARKTHCKRGHQFSAENLYESSGRRYCRACRNREQQIRRKTSAIRSLSVAG